MTKELRTKGKGGRGDDVVHVYSPIQAGASPRISSASIATSSHSVQPASPRMVRLGASEGKTIVNQDKVESTAVV